MSEPLNPKTHEIADEKVADEAAMSHHDHIHDVGEKVDYDRSGAIDAEKIEHDMTVIQAVKAYPAASWWAFVMSCTIVSYCHIRMFGR